MSRYPRISDTEDRFDTEGNKLCRNCDSLIGKGRRHYCSSRCMKKFFRNNTWRCIREDVLRRDNFICSICDQRFRQRYLDVDHIIPIQMGGQVFDKKNLRVLCKDCHKAKSKLDSEVLAR